MNEPLTDLELDALRELCSVGGAYAANALCAVLKGVPVTLDVPSARVLRPDALSDAIPPEEAIVIGLGVEGGLSAQILLRLSAQDARQLSGWLLSKDLSAWPLDESALSALSETGNILSSACLNALGRMTGLRLIPTVPSLKRVASDWKVTDGYAVVGSFVVMLEALLSAKAEAPLRVQLLLFPDPAGLPELFFRLGLGRREIRT